MEDENERIEITMRKLRLLAKKAAQGDAAVEEVLTDQLRLLYMSSAVGMPENRIMDNLDKIAAELDAVATQKGLTIEQVIELLVRNSSDPDETRARFSLAFKIRGLKGSGAPGGI